MDGLEIGDREKNREHRTIPMAILTQNEMQRWEDLNRRFVVWGERFGDLKTEFLQLEADVYLPDNDTLLRKAAVDDDLDMRRFRLYNFINAKLNSKSI